MLVGIAIAAAIFLVIQMYVIKDYEHIGMSYLQGFVGVLFLFSGVVKAMDPLGTAYKIDQYFAEFQGAFETSWMSWIAPIFPAMQEYSVGLSVGMIVFEMVLGVLIIFGIYKKFSAWSFLLLIIAFTFMTGFTFLTGYVPNDGTFFNFSSWGPYVESNMKVTDCGCFGDFIKLEPFTSFLKDVFLLIPGLLFLLFPKKMHTTIKPKYFFATTLVTTLLFSIYCFSNYIWDIPQVDFRPFKEGVDIKAQKEIEQDAAAQVQVIGFKMQHKTDKNRITDIKMSEYSAYSDEWEVIEQLKTEAPIKSTKISEFDLRNIDGDEAAYEILEHKGKALMIVAYELKGETSVSKKTVEDTIVVVDPESEAQMQTFKTREVEIHDFKAKPDYAKAYTEKLIPFVQAAKKAGYRIYFLTDGFNEEVRDFVKDIGLDAEPFLGDPLLLKTIIRSNPGVLIMEDAKILKKYHIRKLPNFQEINI